VAQDDVNAKVTSGWQALQAGNLKEARSAFQSVIDAAPNYDFGWYALGQIATREGKVDEAITSFKKATELNADKFEYHYGLAAAYRTKEDYTKAIATMNNAEDLAKDKQSTYYLHLERGLSYLSIRQYDRAATDLQKAVQAQPGQAMAHQRLGMALYATEDFAGAVDNLKKAAAKDAKDYTTQIYLARGAINLGQREADKNKKAAYYNEAVKAAQAAQSLKAGFEAQNTLAKAHLGAGSYDQAARAFQAVLQGKPKYCAAQVNLGQSYLAMEAWPQAADAMKKAVECDPKSTLALNLLAFIYVKQDLRKEALATYERSYGMKADPAVAKHIELVKENIRIAEENATIDNFNDDQRAALEAEKAEFERKRKEYEEQQKKIQEYKEKDN
jgi:superkiller protein 3